MTDPEQMYALLQRRDDTITRLRHVIDDVITELATMYAEDERGKATERATNTLRAIYTNHGFHTDGRNRD